MVRNTVKSGLEMSRSERNIVPILGVCVDSTRKRRVLTKITKFLEQIDSQARVEGEGKLFIVTPNPEIVNLASKDTLFRSVLGQAHLSLPDGIGIIMAQKFAKLQVPKFPGVTQLALFGSGLLVGISAAVARDWLFSEGETVPGRLVFEDLVMISAKRGWKVFLLGGAPGVAEKAAENFLGKYAALRVDWAVGPRLGHSGKPLNEGEARVEYDTVARINTFKPDLLFVGFGAPKQEYWLARNLPRLDVRVGMVVGGAFDSVAGTVIRAPQLITELGLEWLWRLVTQPWRLFRIFTAVVVFPLKVFAWRLKHG